MIDGKAVNISFARDTKAMAPAQSTSKGMSSVAAQALAAASWGMGTAAPPPKQAAPKRAAPQQTTTPGQAGNSYVFDQNSGLYYDSASGFYYDPANQVRSCQMRICCATSESHPNCPPPHRPIAELAPLRRCTCTTTQSSRCTCTGTPRPKAM